VYRVRREGFEHYEAAGERVLIVANHVSFLDAVLLAVFLPDRLTFAIDPRIARLRWVRPFLAFVDVLPVDPRTPFATKALIGALDAGKKVVIFPEGRISVTGALMKIYSGPAFVADHSKATVLPVRIAGAEYTPFSYLRGRVSRRWFPRITLTMFPPRRMELPEHLRGAARRREAARRLSDLMADLVFRTTNYRRTVADALLEARAIHGGRHVIVEDLDREPLTYDQLLIQALVLSRVVERETQPGERVGVLLPAIVPALVTLLGIQLAGRVPAMLNFTAGADGMRAACDTAEIRTIYTSHRFTARAKLDSVVQRLAERVRVRWLEDVKGGLGIGDTIVAWLKSRWSGGGRYVTHPDDPAVVLFTAGSEGTPKGVVLSHANLLANRAQLLARLDFGPTDLVLNTLPPFHAFGLATGLLLPVLSGVKVFLYPSPLDYRAIPEVAYDIDATIMFGTNTFLAGYARFAHPYDFYRLRYVFAGAERLEPETRQTWIEKFGLRILEGYGATETSPVLATNTAMEHRTGTVGRFLPGVEHYLEPVAELERGGRLCVRGPNVMLGYLRPRTGELRTTIDKATEDEGAGQPEPPRTERGQGWYDTGDIVTIDDDGFVTVEGRAKRFAKVGGEMVSLAVIEELARRLWPERRHAAITLPDPRRGEQVLLLTEQVDAQRQDLLRQAQTEGRSELYVPRQIVHVNAIPVLGAGKTDYVAARELAKKHLATKPEAA
jgi:acyl-[acyl-carrier-protein]-phospholipid O-acyltransferase/long-chain-fatty-acid--[acyl-carrier-protein] ligase